MSKILIVDDNRQSQYMLSHLLKGNGFEVRVASNGAEALALAREEAPDLIIADILMPVMDGFTLCREWKADGVLKKHPFVFYTATYTDPRDQKLAMDLGADRFIIKPEEPSVFVEELREILGEFERGKLEASRPKADSEALLKQYSEAVSRKLEHKLGELERAHEELKRHASEQERIVRERTAELQRMVNLMAGREIRMSELKEDIRRLREQLRGAGPSGSEIK